MENENILHPKLLQLCLTLCDPMDCRPSDSSVFGILRQKYWSGFPCPPTGDLPDLETQLTSPVSPTLASRVLYHYLHLGSLKIYCRN